MIGWSIVSFLVGAVYSDARRDHAEGRILHEIKLLTVRLNGVERRLPGEQ